MPVRRKVQTAMLCRPCRPAGAAHTRQLPAFRYRTEKSSKRRTVCWSERDSNCWSPSKEMLASATIRSASAPLVGRVKATLFPGGTGGSNPASSGGESHKPEHRGRSPDRTGWRNDRHRVGRTGRHPLDLGIDTGRWGNHPTRARVKRSGSRSLGMQFHAADRILRYAAIVGRYGGPRMRRGGPHAHRSMFATDGSHADGRRAPKFQKIGWGA